jgi:hypothetical protein
MAEIEYVVNIWDDFFLNDLDGLNTPTSSMETMPIEITTISKYVNALPLGRWLRGDGHKIGWALGHLGGDVSLEELS